MKKPTIIALARRRLRTAQRARSRAEDMAYLYDRERAFWRVEAMQARNALRKLERKT